MYKCIKCGCEVKEGKQICSKCNHPKPRPLTEDSYYGSLMIKEEKKQGARNLIETVMKKMEEGFYSTETLMRFRRILEEELAKL